MTKIVKVPILRTKFVFAKTLTIKTALVSNIRGQNYISLFAEYRVEQSTKRKNIVGWSELKRIKTVKFSYAISISGYSSAN